MNTAVYTPSTAEVKEGQTYLSAEPDVLSLSDPTRFYRYEIGQVDLLSNEEVTHLAQRIEHGRGRKRGRGRKQLQELAVNTEETEEALSMERCTAR